MGRTADEYEAAYALKKAALGPHVIARWGWDDAQQRAIMDEKWRAKTFFRIEVEGEPVGTITVDATDGGIEIGEFYIAPEFQGRGIGGAVLEAVVREAGGRPLELRVLKWNPALALYRRQGFVVVGETDIHYLMEGNTKK